MVKLADGFEECLQLLKLMGSNKNKAVRITICIDHLDGHLIAAVSL